MLETEQYLYNFIKFISDIGNVPEHVMRHVADNNNNNLLHYYAFLDTQSALHSKGAIYDVVDELRGVGHCLYQR